MCTWPYSAMYAKQNSLTTRHVFKWITDTHPVPPFWMLVMNCQAKPKVLGFSRPSMFTLLPYWQPSKTKVLFDAPSHNPCSPCAPQVDTQNHTWGNYVMAAYKVGDLTQRLCFYPRHLTVSHTFNTHDTDHVFLYVNEILVLETTSVDHHWPCISICKWDSCPGNDKCWSPTSKYGARIQTELHGSSLSLSLCLNALICPPLFYLFLLFTFYLLLLNKQKHKEHLPVVFLSKPPPSVHHNHNHLPLHAHFFPCPCSYH